MSTLSAATAASLLVGLMAMAPKTAAGSSRPLAPERSGRSQDSGRHDPPRCVPAAALPRTSRS